MRTLIPLLTLAACIDSERPPTDGLHGELRFTDLTRHVDRELGSAGLGWPVAVGAEIDVGVYGWDPEAGDLAAGISSGVAFELLRDVGDSIRLRALEPGESTLHVIADDGRDDEVVLAAAAVDAVELVRNDDAYLFDVTLPDALGDVGEAFLPGARAGLAAMLYGDGQRLTGELALPWDAVAGLTTAPFDDVANGAWLTTETPGVYPVDLGYGEAWTLEFLAPDAPLTLRLYEPSYDPLVQLDALTGAEGLALFGLGVFAEDGAFVRAPADAELTFEILDGRPDLIRSVDYSAQLLGFSASVCEGYGRVRLTLAGASLELPVEIAAGDDPSCG